MISEVPGLTIPAKKKKRTLKQANHSSTLPPAYERIKAQLERRNKLKERAREFRARDDRGNDKRELVVNQQSGGGENDGEGSRGEDNRQNDGANEIKNASVNRARKKRRKAVGTVGLDFEMEKERKRVEEEFEAANMDLQWVIDKYLNENDWGEDEEKENERSQVDEDRAVRPVHEERVETSQRSQQSQQSQAYPGSPGRGNAQLSKVSSQRPVHEERVETSQRSQARPLAGSQAGGSGSTEGMKVSSQRQRHQERLEELASQKRKEQDSVTESESEDEDDNDNEVAQLDAASSVTESESEEDLPMPPAQQSLGKKRVSWGFTFTFPINFFFGISPFLIHRLKKTTISQHLNYLGKNG